MNHKPVLIATDLSARCDRPLDRAWMLTMEWKVKLYILHVTDPNKMEGLGINEEDIEAQIRTELPKGRVDVEILTAAGQVADTIAEIATQKDCGLIVTGVARYDSVGDIFLGNPVDQLVQYAEQPVLIVKQKPIRSYNNIVIATDFSDGSLFALNTAAELFPDNNLHLVHAYHEPYESWLKSEGFKLDIKSEEQTLMDRFLAKPGIDEAIFQRLNASIEKGDLGQVLQNKIEQTKSELVVLGTHGRSGFSAATIGSKAKSILGWAKQDVLLVHGRK